MTNVAHTDRTSCVIFLSSAFKSYDYISQCSGIDDGNFFKGDIYLWLSSNILRASRDLQRSFAQNSSRSASKSSKFFFWNLNLEFKVYHTIFSGISSLICAVILIFEDVRRLKNPLRFLQKNLQEFVFFSKKISKISQKVSSPLATIFF